MQLPFTKLDWTELDGVVTEDDLRGVYNGQAYPKLYSGEWTEGETLHQFDNSDTFEKDGQVYLLPSAPWSGSSSQPAHPHRSHTS